MKQKRKAERLGDQPVQMQYYAAMNLLAERIDKTFNSDLSNRQVGFVLLVFPFEGHEGRCNYISNGADRKDIVTMFKEQIKYFEGQPQIFGTA